MEPVFPKFSSKRNLTRGVKNKPDRSNASITPNLIGLGENVQQQYSRSTSLPIFSMNNAKGKQEVDSALKYEDIKLNINIIPTPSTQNSVLVKIEEDMMVEANITNINSWTAQEQHSSTTSLLIFSTNNTKWKQGVDSALKCEYVKPSMNIIPTLSTQNPVRLKIEEDMMVEANIANTNSWTAQEQYSSTTSLSIFSTNNTDWNWKDVSVDSSFGG